jgi:hypothetical protein
MKAKVLEVRDSGTFIPMLCVDINPSSGERYNEQRYLMRRVGYPCDGRPNVVMTKLTADGSAATNDPYFWGDRTRATAHNYIVEHWDELRDGDVVDVEFILGERPVPKVSERETAPL